jgi:hypothetical protein
LGRIAASVERYTPAADLETPNGQPEGSIALAELVQVFQRWLHFRDPSVIYFVLATIAANRMDTDPVWNMLVGGPGWGKTELLVATGGLPHVHVTSTVTEAGLLSGTRRKEHATDAKGGLLKQIGDFGFLIIKDFTSILSMNRDVRAALLAALREVFDGKWTRHVGVDGGKTLDWAGKLAVMAGCTGTIDSYHAVIGTMGERFIFYRFDHEEGDEEDQAAKAMDLVGRESHMRQELAKAMAQFFAGIHIPTAPTRPEGEDRQRLISLAILAAHCRSAVERDSRSREIDLIPDGEAPGRLALTLTRLLAGLRTIGVNESEAWALLVKVALDCMPALRRKVFHLLVERYDEKLTTADVAVILSYPPRTAERTLEDLAAHGVICRHQAVKGNAYRWNISDWALTRYRIATKTAPVAG